jgi:hypothetical protein
MYAESKGSLIEFSGLEFRQEAVACPQCSWAGAAGELTVPGVSALADGVTYFCPACETAVGHHSGLSQAEVQSELISIRRELRNELRFTLPHVTQGAQIPNQSTPEETLPAMTVPTFDEVRERIRELC